ncbi:hypothetical protein KSP40_PGU011973 [Platanthera guangdongensis]|uniref:DUF936 domain-containing protein n=1 Tax=Platanthera guangdongensis TaxID=2320717 RepID=A0ABR2MC99_9ASPA
MTTLTPSVLLTLLQFMNFDSIPLGEHRSAVHHVTDIVSAPSSTLSPEDLWSSQDFFIQLSDSVNSTYVYLSDRDAELIVSNRTQLGQLVHLHRLHFGLPVPARHWYQPHLLSTTLSYSWLSRAPHRHSLLFPHT